MEINKEAILKKTHYGIRIYSHVLQQYYPGETVLSLSGRDCQTAKNPFNDNKLTLKVQVVNNLAEHFDIDNSISKGNAFDFAALHYNIQGEELYYKLNEELKLYPGKSFAYHKNTSDVPQAEQTQPDKTHIPVFSHFKAPVSNTIPHIEINLLQVFHLLKSNDFASQTNALRNFADKKEAKKYKAMHFDYVTFSGTFSKRNDNSLLNHSGLITVDFDHISNIPELKSNLVQDEYFETQLLFVSPSGDGLKWVIPVDLLNTRHQDYFRAIANYIKHTYKLEVDPSGKDISRACFLPHDAEAYINPKYL